MNQVSMELEVKHVREGKLEKKIKKSSSFKTTHRVSNDDIQIFKSSQWYRSTD